MQTGSTLENNINPRPPDENKVPFSSNSIRLSGWEWVIVAIVCLALFFAVPMLWSNVEKFEPEPDYRLPYQLSSDYWLYNRYCRWASLRYDTLVVGDSVIWGHYVPQDNTLSHYLNQNAAQHLSAGLQRGQDAAAGPIQGGAAGTKDVERISAGFANMGIDGIHPAALNGLLKYYGGDISGKKVILHLNPLWMSSPKHDLQTDKEFRFNHPKLVPQFIPKIPCCKDPYSKRILTAAEHYAAFFSWTSHLKIFYFEGMDLPTWTLEHPYENPPRAATLEAPVSTDDSLNERASWMQRGMVQQDFAWVELETSLQWRFFRKAVELLRARGNTVFVLVGPFNEHIFKQESRNSYQTMKDGIEAWLRQNHIAYYMPDLLPSELYHDASHPSAEGYAMIAKQLFENPSFQSTILRTGIDSVTERSMLPTESFLSRSHN